MRTLNLLVIGGVTLALGGCASSYRPAVDPSASSVSMDNYDSDLYACRQQANQVQPGSQAVPNAIGGALIGGAIGGLLGSLSGDAGAGIAVGAGIGGLAGAANGTDNEQGDQRSIIDQCMSKRGYAVYHRPPPVVYSAPSYYYTPDYYAAPPPPPYGYYGYRPYYYRPYY